MTGGGGYSGFDPIEDTESWLGTRRRVPRRSYSGFDPIEDTERASS